MMPEIRPLVGSDRRERTTGFFVRGWHDWSSFTPGCNWRDFTVLNVSGEWNHMTERVECRVAMLGLHVELTYAWGDAFYGRINDMRDEMIAADAESGDTK